MNLQKGIELFKTFDHKNRPEIYTLIVDNPGLTVSEITLRLQIKQSMVSHHLKKLREARAIYFEQDGKYRLYYPVESKVELLLKIEELF